MDIIIALAPVSSPFLWLSNMIKQKQFKDGVLLIELHISKLER